MKKTLPLILFILVVFVGCSSTKTIKDDSQNESQEIYVFDDVSEDDTLLTNGIDSINIGTNDLDSIDTDMSEMDAGKTNNSSNVFIVQVGAFTNLNSAENFIKNNQNKISWVMDVSYSDKVNLYVIHLPEFHSREEAESVRNKLWKINSFRDAFIITK